MTTLTAVDDRYTSPGAARGTSSSGLWVTLSMVILVVSTFLVAGYFEHLAMASVAPGDANGGPSGLLTAEFVGGVLRTGMTAFGVGLGPVLVLRALPGIRVRSHRGPLALFAAGVATVLCIMGLLTTLA